MTRVSTSLAVDAETYVRPLINVSTRLAGVFGAAPDGICGVCRITNVKVKLSSSSLLSLRIKFGAGD